MSRFIIHKFIFFILLFGYNIQYTLICLCGQNFISRTRISYLNTVAVKKNEHAIDHNLMKHSHSLKTFSLQKHENKSINDQ